MYLTGKMDEDTITNIAINGKRASGLVLNWYLTPVLCSDAGGDFDALTELRSRTHFGRPDFPAIFNNIRDKIEAGSLVPGTESSLRTNVGVYYCGPGVLAKSLKVQTQAAASDRVKFSFAKEHFVSLFSFYRGYCLVWKSYESQSFFSAVKGLE